MPLSTLPVEQGLKLQRVQQVVEEGIRPLSTLPLKQGLKHVLQLQPRRLAGPLSTLPLKQGLKH